MTHSPIANDPITFYLAARYSRRQSMLGVRDVLTALGHEVSSRWIDGGHQADSDDIDAMRHFAEEDYADIKDAQVVLAFTETPREPSTNRGGRHVEMGLAIALGKTVVVVGPYENAFTTLADEQVPDWSRFVMWLVELNELNADDETLHVMLPPTGEAGRWATLTERGGR